MRFVGRSAVPDGAASDDRRRDAGAFFGLSLEEAISRGTAAEADLARVDEALEDSELRAMWLGVSAWRESLAAAALDGAMLDLEQLFRARRDPPSARREFLPGVDAASATEYAIAQDLVREAAEPWIEVTLRRARFHTAGLVERPLKDLVLTTEQAALAQSLGRCLPAPRLGAQDRRIGAVGMAAPALQVLQIAAAIGDIKPRGATAEMKERPAYAVTEVTVFDEDAKAFVKKPMKIEWGRGTPTAGLQVGRLALARGIMVAAGLKHAVPLLSPAFLELRASYERSFGGEEWPLFWLKAIELTAAKGLVRLKRIREQRSRWSEKLKARHKDAKILRIINKLFGAPYFTARVLREMDENGKMGTQTALDIIAALVAAGIVADTNQANSPRVYRAIGVESIP